MENMFWPSRKMSTTGMGFERTLAILNGFENVYPKPMCSSNIMDFFPGNHSRSVKKRIIADHARASVF